MLYCSWDLARDRCNCYFSFWAICCPFTPLTLKKWTFQEHEKKPGDIIILNIWTKNHNHMLYCSQDTACDRWPGDIITLHKCTKIMIICFTVPETWRMTDVIVIFHFGQFFALWPPNRPKNEHFKKMKKTGDIIILHNWTKNHNHMLYCSWAMARDGCNCYFSFWAIFCPLTP